MAYPTYEDIDNAIPVGGEPNRALTNATLKAIVDEAVQEALSKVDTNDERLSDSRTPTGSAGGVLTGTYPNPSFAQNIATEEQLDGKISLTEKGQNGGVAPLDEAGLVPLQHLNVSGLEYKGAWNPNTNTPELNNGGGTTGDFYKASHDGSHDFGVTPFDFFEGDWVMYAAGVWQRLGSRETVSSVNGMIGAVEIQVEWNDILNKPNLESAGNGVPIGTVLTWLAPTLPTGFIWLDEYSAGTYPELDALFPNGAPDIANRVFRHVGDLTGAVGSTQEDAMQQITGYIDNVWTGGPARQGGAFTRNTANTSARPSTGTQANARFDFDSANSPGARTADETRVKSVIFRAIIKAYN